MPDPHDRRIGHDAYLARIARAHAYLARRIIDNEIAAIAAVGALTEIAGDGELLQSRTVRAFGVSARAARSRDRSAD